MEVAKSNFKAMYQKNILAPLKITESQYAEFIPLSFSTPVDYKLDLVVTRGHNFFSK